MTSSTRRRARAVPSGSALSSRRLRRTLYKQLHVLARRHAGPAFGDEQVSDPARAGIAFVTNGQLRLACA